MGFGSYDEDEQENQETDASEIEVTDDDRIHHEGSVEFSSDENTAELINRLQEMKDDDVEDVE